jgi:RNA polymerase sigma factor (sigma-70 family)
MHADRPLSNRIVARAVREGMRSAATSDSRRLSLTTRIVVARLEPFVRSVAAELTRSGAPKRFTDDLVQEALLALATSLVRLRRIDVAGLEAFAYGVARNRMRSLLERERGIRGWMPFTATEPPSLELGPDEIALRRDLIRSIRRAAARLRPADRRIVWMLLRGQDSRAEIAPRCGISLEAAAMRKSRTLSALRAAARDRRADAGFCDCGG